jgi:hypothetical protein
MRRFIKFFQKRATNPEDYLIRQIQNPHFFDIMPAMTVKGRSLFARLRVVARNDEKIAQSWGLCGIFTPKQ